MGDIDFTPFPTKSDTPTIEVANSNYDGENT